MKKIVFMIAMLTASPAFAETVHVGVEGMVCAFCAKGIESNFKKNEAVEKVDVDLEKSLVTVTTKAQKTVDDETIKKIITDSGYTPTTIHHAK